MDDALVPHPRVPHIRVTSTVRALGRDLELAPKAESCNLDVNPKESELSMFFQGCSSIFHPLQAAHTSGSLVRWAAIQLLLQNCVSLRAWWEKWVVCITFFGLQTAFLAISPCRTIAALIY